MPNPIYIWTCPNCKYQQAVKKEDEYEEMCPRCFEDMEKEKTIILEKEE